MLPVHTQDTQFRVVSLRKPGTISRVLRWSPLLLAIPLIFWLLGPYSIRLTSPPPSKIFDFPTAAIPPPPLKITVSGPPHHVNAQTASPLWGDRAQQVKNAFVHAYTGYMDHAFPADELLPISARKTDNFVGWGVTVFDALDTMWIMGLDEQFYAAIHFVQTVDFFQTNAYAPFFETVIRHLGGLLSAYALSGEPTLLTKADELGRGLLPVFNTTSGLPEYGINVKSGAFRGSWAAGTIWSESMSCQLEYKYLAHLTGKREYFDKVEHLTNMMYNFNLTNGFPVMWDKESGLPKDDRFAVGALADSGYEYFIKQYLLTSHSEQKVLDLYLKSAAQIVSKLLFLTPNRQLLYVTDTRGGVPSNVFEHLSCFLSGMLALGAHTLGPEYLTASEKELHMWAAEGLAQSCVLMYFDQPSGMGPDEVYMTPYPNWEEGRWVDHVRKWESQGRKGGVPPGVWSGELIPERNETKRDARYKGRNYVLRPETVESLYILWRTTGDVRYREWGWTIFQSIEQHAKTEYGYAVIDDVSQADPRKKDEMPSFFLAETLKYLFLLFTDEEIVPLDQFVFNTEAHPLPVFEWTSEQRGWFQVS